VTCSLGFSESLNSHNINDAVVDWLHRAELKASSDRYLEEKTLCATLSNYLRQRYGIITPSTSCEDSDRPTSVQPSVSPGITSTD